MGLGAVAEDVDESRPDGHVDGRDYGNGDGTGTPYPVKQWEKLMTEIQKNNVAELAWQIIEDCKEYAKEFPVGPVAMEDASPKQNRFWGIIQGGVEAYAHLAGKDLEETMLATYEPVNNFRTVLNA